MHNALITGKKLLAKIATKEQKLTVFVLVDFVVSSHYQSSSDQKLIQLIYPKTSLNQA